MPWPKTGATFYYALLELPDKGRKIDAIKELQHLLMVFYIRKNKYEGCELSKDEETVCAVIIIL